MIRARRKPKRKFWRSIKRDRILLALADAGDIAVGSLYLLASVPFTIGQISQRAWDYGASFDMRYNRNDMLESSGGDGSALFRDMAEMRVYLTRLKKQGLVVQKRRGFAALSAEGVQFLRTSFGYPVRTRMYIKNKKARSVLTMVIFDVPEKRREMRDWLRFHLKSLDFRFVQGSVWIGDTPLPAEFMKDIKRFGLLSCVHVFSINRTGTMSVLLKKFGFGDYPANE